MCQRAIHSFNEAGVLSTLRQLSPRARTAFAVACASRVALLDMPPLPQFVTALCKRAASLAEVFAASGELDRAEAESLVADLESCSDHLDDDRVASFAFVSRHLLSSEPQEALWAARRAYEACDAIAQQQRRSSILDRNEEHELLSHPTVQAELACQARHLAELAAPTP